MVGWHHQLKGHEFEQAPGVGDGQGSLSCCSLWDCKEWNTTEWLNWTDGSHRCFGGITQEIKTRLSKNEATLIHRKELRVPACEVPSVVSDSLRPLDCSPQGSSVHGILQAWKLERVAMPSSRGFSQPRNWTSISCGSCIAGGFFTAEPQGKLTLKDNKFK